MRSSGRFESTSVVAALVCLVVCGLIVRRSHAQSVPTADVSQTGRVIVDATPSHILNSFEPDKAIGSSIDVLSHDVIDEIYTPQIMKEMLSAGYGTISYRNNSELRALAWHWNPNGTWSDSVHQSGYFTESTELKEPISYIVSYSLPHHGTSGGRGGTSPLTDGDLTTYWKSNPYLTSKFTGESDSLHPQWVVIDCGKNTPIDTVRIAWMNPYAVNYDVAYWAPANGATREHADPLSRDPNGQWMTFPSGTKTNAQGGTVTLKLSDQPIMARYLRVQMTQSSNTCDRHGADDARNCVGYAISEIYVQDAVSFTEQSVSSTAVITVSSVDPWHSADDAIANGRSQHTGFDLFFTSGITRGLPAMIPVTMLYGTPEGAAAEIAYIEKRGYPISYVEMGEEPDGQKMRPEDYAALYIQWATAIHKADPNVKLGGPVFEGINEDIKLWPDAQGRTSWTRRFFDYMTAHGRLDDVTFWSTEHYPLEPCGIQWTDLYKEPEMMTHVMQSFRDSGLPKNVPIMVTESSVSWRLTGPMSQIFGGLWLADNVGSFFAAGGEEFHHSPIQPQLVQSTCDGSATWSNFVPDKGLNVKGYTAFYFAARLVNLERMKHGAGIHRMFPSSTDAKDAAGNTLVTSYALLQPDGEWSLMLVNRDQSNSHPIRVTFDDGDGKNSGFFKGPVRMVTFGSEQYVWKEAGPQSHADPDGPSVDSHVSSGRETAFTLPKASITVLRGKVDGLPKMK